MEIKALECPVMHYAWGERESDGGAYIAELLGQDGGDQTWAELWIGAHDQASSVVMEDAKPLNQMIQEAPEATLGKKMLAQGRSSLPFLLKILCCSTVLSIQSHPDKATAVRLHQTMPEAFPDDNHKPEVICAISDFELMAGFRPLDELKRDLWGLKALEPWRVKLSDTSPLRETIGALFQLDGEQIQRMAGALREETLLQGGRFALFRRLVSQYPGDSGVFFTLLLNYMTLHPGEAIFVKANMPHAYVKGRCIECMANSNNVIRAGLTQKYVNRQLLLDTLEFVSVTPEKLKIKSTSAGMEFVCRDDFALQTVRLGKNASVPVPLGRATVMMMVEGQAQIKSGSGTIGAARGSAWFIPATASETAVVASVDGTLIAVASVPEG